MKPADYPDCRQLSKAALPAKLEETITTLREELSNNGGLTAAVADFRGACSQIHPSKIADVAHKIRIIGKLWNTYERLPHPSKSRSIGHFFRKKPETALDVAKKQLSQHPALGFYYQFHGNGYIRAAALAALNEPPQSSFELAAAVYRLNDWAEPVRIEAEQYFERISDAIDPEIAADALVFVLVYSNTFVRWNGTQKAYVKKLTVKETTVAALKEIMLTSVDGKLGRTFSQLLSGDKFDCALFELGVNAKLPVIRAIALDALINSRARWYAGKKKVWTDKRYGEFRNIADFQTRIFQHSLNVEKLLTHASNDHAKSVRRIAADYLVAHYATPTKTLNQLARRLKTDRSGSIRARVVFYLKKQNKL